ncbi:MAG TPA: UPF0280 family protein [Candidatus Marinimicrobia bacterium]|nr:UPF0280 family protein [Candidatus Neomarinimicrobiota bacterium]
MYEPRTYRNLAHHNRFQYLNVDYLETDLRVACHPAMPAEGLARFIRASIIALREKTEQYALTRPEFFSSYVPIAADFQAPVVVKKMISAARIAQVGPMAAVAGCFAEEIGKRIKAEFQVKELIIENGGDIYLDIAQETYISIFAGDSPLSNKIALKITPDIAPLGVCTSSGKVGHSFSYGRANAVTIACRDAALADAFATAFGNRVRTAGDIQRVLTDIRANPSILAACIIVDDQLAIQGKFEFQLIES